MALENPFRVRFKKEKAFDLGGVTRDLFSAFFCEAYRTLFDGSTYYFPAVHAAVDMKDMSTLGRVISHMYLIAGIIPDRIAFPCLAAIFLGPSNVPSNVPDQLLQDYFVGCLSTHETSTLQRALNTQHFTPELQCELVSILGVHGCRSIPRPSNLKKLMVEAARYTFFMKPAASLQAINAGIPSEHRPFWNSITVQKLHAVYMSLSVTVSKVLELLEEPTLVTEGQQLVWQYLKSYVGNMQNEELRMFLRFITGSFVIVVPKISVTFNTLDGLARRPLSHTCSATLDLPSTYTSLPEFSSEFRAILSDPCYSWRMDAI